MEPQNVAILIFNGVQIIDYTGPYETFGQAAFGNRRFFTPFTVSQSTDPIETAMKMTVVPTYDFANCPSPDVLVVPGGNVNQHLENEALLDWIRTTAESAEFVLSVCNGAFFLAKASLLEGLSATTTAGLHDRLQEMAPNTRIVRNQRFVDNGKIVTTAGLSSGIDGALHIISKKHGPGWAMQAAVSMEYDWRPDSNYTRAMLADTRLPAQLYDFILPNGDLLQAKGDTQHWLEKWQIESDTPASEMQQALESRISAETHWQPTEGGWHLQDSDGTNWEMVVLVSPAENHHLLLDFTIQKI
jgi:transcriptional regulator GlxA family with amidase domain